MPTRLPQLRSIEAFVVAAQTQSFTTAANMLHLTTSAMSRRITLLEDDLVVELFLRSPRSVKLTAVGESFHSKVAPALEALRAASEAVHQRDTRQALRVTAPPAFAGSWLIPRIYRFEQEHPMIHVSIETMIDDFGPLERGVDLAFRFGEGNWEDVNSTRFLDVVAFPVCSPTFHKRHGPFTSARDICRHTLLGLKRRPQLWQQWFARSEWPGLRQAVDSSFDDFYLLYEAASNGMGVAIGVDVMVALSLKEAKLVRIGADECRLVEGVYVVRGLAPAGPPLTLFLAWLSQEANSWARRRGYDPRKIRGPTPEPRGGES